MRAMEKCDIFDASTNSRFPLALKKKNIYIVQFFCVIHIKIAITMINKLDVIFKFQLLLKENGWEEFITISLEISHIQLYYTVV